ncbi:MAG TPA: SRPBCC domain-containing protein [Tepidiformaceae bacterium]|nr:SRPBCC domain-containing protein [Tepidiformaceae bacterium]
MIASNNPSAQVATTRLVSTSPREVFAAFEDAELLTKWWGPKDFTSTFEVFEFCPGGRWVFALRAPHGATYPNESVFRELDPAARLVIEHISKPHYILTVTLAGHGAQTLVTWTQEFESPEAAAKLRPIVEPGNEQNLDRLEAVLAGR